MNERPDPATPNPVGLVIGALAFGAALGLGLQGLVTWGVRSLQAGQPAGPVRSLSSPPALLLLIGTFAGIVAAGLATWSLLAPIRNPWRQAMLGIIAGLGSFAISLVTIPVELRFGRGGLLGVALAGGLLCLFFGRRLSKRRAAAGSAP